MKILVLQLARLGDIYLSWPALRALRRQNPQAQIEVLTRSRFQAALSGCDAVSKVRVLETKDILAPLIRDEPDIPESFRQTEKVIDELREQKYDWIINFSFSPASSFIAHAIKGNDTKVTGYSRFTDGYLAIEDDMSAYFYAQVGPGRPNRFHLAEVFATLCEADLIAEDWAAPTFLKSPARVREGIVIHVGASDSRKAISPAKWSAIINQIRKFYAGHIFLIGAQHERALAEKILDSVPTEQVKNMVGETNLIDIFHLLNHAGVLIGCDSAPIHMASLSGTPCLNISLPAVNFWETGPRSPKSFVLRSGSEEELASDRVAEVVQKILENRAQDLSVITGISGAPSYRALCPRDQEFQWKLVTAIYRGEQFPEPPDETFTTSIEKLNEVNQLMLDQMRFIAGGGDLNKVAGIINRGEEIISAISKLSPSVSPLVRWYQTEKLRIGPGPQSQILIRTVEIHELLDKALSVYRLDQTNIAETL